jgi:outer membrane protein assembly factor BamB
VADGRVFFGGEDGILYVLGRGREVPIVPVAADRQRPSPPAGSSRPTDLEWHTAGGDLGHSFVSPDATIKPPFRVRWKTRIWGSFKGPIIVAEGLAFCANRLGQLAALDADTGRIIWRTSHPHLESRPGPTYADGKLLVLRGSLNQRGQENEGGGLWCHDAKTGKLVWRKPVRFAYHYNPDGLLVHQCKVLVAVSGPGGAVEATAYSLADGEEIWRRLYEGLLPVKTTRPVRICGVAGDGRWYFSIPAQQSRKGAKPTGGLTLAVDPGRGDVIWKNADYGVFQRSRIAFRKGVLVVFAKDAAHALDAATGKHLWTGHGPDEGKLYLNTYYHQPLTDLYLDSKGARGICPAHACSYSVFTNGAWYGHLSPSAPTLVARVPGDKPDERGATVNRTIWEHRFSSHACPAPSPAYGRLYYAPNGEGVVYCFEPIEL